MFLKTPAMASGFFLTSTNVSPVSIKGPGRQGPWGNVGRGINKPRNYPEGEGVQVRGRFPRAVPYYLVLCSLHWETRAWTW